MMSLHSVQQHRHLFDNLDIESLERRNLSRMVGKQANASQIQIRKDLRPDADLALRLAFALGQRRKALIAMEGEHLSLSYALNRKAFRSLMKVDERAPAFTSDG